MGTVGVAAQAVGAGAGARAGAEARAGRPLSLDAILVGGAAVLTLDRLRLR